MNTNWVRRGDLFRKYSHTINKISVLILFYASDADYPINKIKIHIQSREVTKILSYEVNITSRRGAGERCNLTREYFERGSKC